MKLNHVHLHYILIVMLFTVHVETTIICPSATWTTNATTVAGSPLGVAGSTSQLLSSPVDVFVDNNGTLYISDSTNSRVQKWLSNASNGTTVAGGSLSTSLSQFDDMQGVRVTTNGYIYVVDSGNARVMKWAPNGTFDSIVAGGNGIGNQVNQLNFPVGLFVDSATMAIWIADTNNHRIVRWPIQSTSDIRFGSYGTGNNQFKFPRGLFVDTNKSAVYIADTYNHRIQKWIIKASNATTVAGKSDGTYGTTNDALYYPQAVIVDANGNIYVSDTYNNRIMRWLANSTFGILVAGQNTAGSGANLLNTPLGLSFDPSGSLVIADSRNMRVQKFAISCCE